MVFVPTWTEGEERFIVENISLQDKELCVSLARTGKFVSVAAVRQKRERMGLLKKRGAGGELTDKGLERLQHWIEWLSLSPEERAPIGPHGPIS